MASVIIGNGDTDTIYIQQIGDSYYYSINDSPLTPITTFPIQVFNSTTLNNVLPILFSTDLTITDPNFYFVCRTPYLQFGSELRKTDGARYTITVSGVTDYPGFIQNGTVSLNGYNNVSMYNLVIHSVSSTLATDAGWLCQSGYGAAGADNLIENCASDGDIPRNTGGLVGSFAAIRAGTLTILGCNTTGEIGLFAGGIISQLGAMSSGSVITINQCWSSGMITDNAGGMTGNSCGINGGTVNCINCYSTGAINSTSGGIFGVTNGSNGFANAINCYSTGVIGGGSGGIFSGNAGVSDGTATATNCYSTGNISSFGGGIYGIGFGNATATHCYTTGTLATPDGGIFSNSSVIGPTNYSEGANSSSGWNNVNAEATLTGVPTSTLYGTTWCQPNGVNTPYALSVMGFSPYRLVLTTTADAYITAGQSTPVAAVPGYTYSILSVNDAPSVSGITIDTTTGSIITTRAVPGALYTIIVYSSINPYSITTYLLNLSAAPPLPTDTLPTMCCMPNNKMNGLSYPTMNALTIGNNVSQDIARCTPHLPLPSYSFYYSFVMKNNFNK